MEDLSFQSSCPVSDALSIIGGKWKVIIIHHLDGQVKRFNQLMRDMPNITQRMLTLQLRELERDGLVYRHDYHQVPPRVEYSLTQQGQTLIPVLNAIHAWGEAHSAMCLQARLRSQGEQAQIQMTVT